jgi:hypothetical protein
MSLKKITYNNKIYKQNKITNSYLCHDDDICSLLVFAVPEENWKGYTDINKVSDAMTNNMDNNSFEEYIIDYEYYVAGIHFLDYIPSPQIIC